MGRYHGMKCRKDLTSYLSFDIIISMINGVESKIKAFLENLDRSSRTIFAYQNALNQFVAAVGKEADLNLESYVEFLKAIKSKSPSTKRVYTTAVRKFYAFHKAWNSDELKEATEHYTRAQG